MGTIAFFPWLELSEDVNLREWSVVRYRRATAPFGAGHPRQSECDSLLRGFADSVGMPLERCSIVLKAGDLWQIDDPEVADLFRFSEALAFAALAEREFFHWDYWNRDNLRLTVRHYVSPEAGTTLQIARRDGATLTYVATEKFQTRRPPHVPLVENVRIGRELLAAVDAAFRGDSGGRIWDAITAYNQANTDNPDVPWEIEVVYLVSALQRLLDARSACADLVERTNAILPRQCSGPWPCPRNKDPKFVRAVSKAPNIRSAWLAELCSLRGHLAHGRAAAAFPGIWSIREHLLLGSYLFPRIVRFVLRDLELLATTPDDVWDVRVFDRLAAHYHFESDADEHDAHGRPVHPWRRIWRHRSMRISTHRLAALLSKHFSGEG